MEAGEPLDTVGRGVSTEEACLLEGPSGLQGVVELAVGVWAVGWLPGSGSCGAGAHALLVAGHEPETISEAQPMLSVFCGDRSGAEEVRR